jgi:hypothetical protein
MASQPRYVGPATVLDNGDVAYQHEDGGLRYAYPSTHSVRQDEQGNYHVFEHPQYTLIPVDYDPWG